MPGSYVYPGIPTRTISKGCWGRGFGGPDATKRPPALKYLRARGSSPAAGPTDRATTTSKLPASPGSSWSNASARPSFTTTLSRASSRRAASRKETRFLRPRPGHRDRWISQAKGQPGDPSAGTDIHQGERARGQESQKEQRIDEEVLDNGIGGVERGHAMGAVPPKEEIEVLLEPPPIIGPRRDAR